MRAGNEQVILGAFGHSMSVFLGNSCLIVYLLSEAWGHTPRRPRLAESELVLHSLRQEVPTQNGVMVKLRKSGFSSRSTSEPHFLKAIYLL